MAGISSAGSMLNNVWNLNIHEKLLKILFKIDIYRDCIIPYLFYNYCIATVDVSCF